MRKSMSYAAAAVASVFILTGCANMSDTQRRTTTGAGVGALAGAVIGGDAKGAAIGAGVGALGTYIWSQHMEKQKREMEVVTQGTGVSVTQTQDNQLKLDIPSDISFAVNRSDIQANFAPILDRFAEGLRSNPRAEVRIIGHTDSTGNDSINEPLSRDRALSAKTYLTQRGVDGSRITTEGRGAREPIATNGTAEGRSRNRRVEIYMGERQ